MGSLFKIYVFLCKYVIVQICRNLCSMCFYVMWNEFKGLFPFVFGLNKRFIYLSNLKQQNLIEVGKSKQNVNDLFSRL